MPASAPVAYLRAQEIDELHDTAEGDPAKLRHVEQAQARTVPPIGDGDVHDCAASYVHTVVQVHAFPRDNRRVAFRGTYRIYGRNGWQVIDGDELGEIVVAADERHLSPGAICERLQLIVEQLF